MFSSLLLSPPRHDRQPRELRTRSRRRSQRVKHATPFVGDELLVCNLRGWDYLCTTQRFVMYVAPAALWRKDLSKIGSSSWCMVLAARRGGGGSVGDEIFFFPSLSSLPSRDFSSSLAGPPCPLHPTNRCWFRKYLERGD